MTVWGQYFWVVLPYLNVSEVFRSLLLNLPMNPKSGKTWACQLPSMKYFSIVCLFSFFIFGFIQVFQTRRWDFRLASVRGFSLPLVYWDFYARTFNQVFCLPSNSTDILTIVSCMWKHIAKMFFFKSAPLTWNVKVRDNTARVWEEKINPPFILCKSVYRFFLYTLSESFSAGLMYWLLCNSWTKHRLELIFKEKRLYSIFVL